MACNRDIARNWVHHLQDTDTGKNELDVLVEWLKPSIPEHTITEMSTMDAESLYNVYSTKITLSCISEMFHANNIDFSVNHVRTRDSEHQSLRCCQFVAQQAMTRRMSDRTAKCVQLSTGSSILRGWADAKNSARSILKHRAGELNIV